jgi:hypothetical protein
VQGDPSKPATAGQVESEWKTDRARLVQVGECLERLICIKHDERREIGKVEDEPVCERPPETKPANRR